MKISKYLPLILFFVFVCSSILLNAQCPMCRATAEKSDYAKSLNTGIIYLLLAPVFILGSVFLIWYRNKNKFSNQPQ